MAAHEPWWPLGWLPFDDAAKQHIAYTTLHPFVSSVRRTPSATSIHFEKRGLNAALPSPRIIQDCDDLTLRAVLINIAYGAPNDPDEEVIW